MSTPRIRGLRRVLLVALALTGAGLVGLYLFGRAGRPPSAGLGDQAAQSGESRLVGSGFDYTVTRGDVPIFRVRGERVRSDQNDNVDLDGAELTFFRDKQPVYTLRGKTARYNRETQAARIDADVSLTGPRGAALQATGLEVAAGGDRLKSVGPVTFQLGRGLAGQAAGLSGDLRTDTFAFEGDVRAASLPGEPGEPASLRADRLVLERIRDVVRAEGNVRLQRGADTLEAVRVAAHLDDEEHRIRFITARWDIHGEVQSADGHGSTLRFHGDRLEVQLDPAGKRPEQVQLEAEDDAAPCGLEATDADGAVRTMTAPVFFAQFADGTLQSADALKGVVIEEAVRAGGPPSRHAEAGRLESSFLPDGKVQGTTLIRDVVLREAGFEAFGDRAYLDPQAGRAELFGDLARASSDRGELQAPHIVYTRNDGLVRADGGVKGMLRRADGGALSGTPLGGGEGPVQLESASAVFQEKQRQFFFQGKVRAWRGSSLLLADQLQGDEANGRLSAAGSVKTVWVPPPPTDLAAAPGGDAKPPAPIEVTAPTLAYSRDERVALYSGGVTVRQEKRVLDCDALRVELDADQKARWMRCRGNTRLDDPEFSRRVTGRDADYDVAARVLTIDGDPVTLVDPVHGKAEGKRVIYDVDKGNLRLLSHVAEASPAGGAR